MVEKFAGGYYLANLLVTPYGGDRAILPLDTFDKLQQKYSFTYPLVFKVDRLYIPVYGEMGVPSETLALPEETFDRLDMDDADFRDVLLAKRGTVEKLICSFEDLTDGSEK